MLLFPGGKLNGFGADLLLKLMDLWESEAILRLTQLICVPKNHFQNDSF